jgi:hypothetical protein
MTKTLALSAAIAAASLSIAVAHAKPKAKFDQVGLVKIDTVAMKVTKTIVDADGKVTLDRNSPAHPTSGPVTDQATAKELEALETAFAKIKFADVPATIPPPKMLAGGLPIQLLAKTGGKDYGIEAHLGFYGDNAELGPLVRALEAIEKRVIKAHPHAPTAGVTGAIPH